ncbi:MAG: GspMb/PilO family protein [Paracoccaceae bacterium]
MTGRLRRRSAALRTLAIAIAVGIAALPGIALYLGLARHDRAVRAEIAAMRAEAARLRSRIVPEDALVARQAALLRQIAATGVLVAAETPQLAFGALQTEIGRAVRGAGGDVVRIGFSAPARAGPMMRLDLDLLYRAEPVAALEILERLETMRPLLLLERATIAPGGARGLIRADTAQMLEIEMRLAAHLRETAE